MYVIGILGGVASGKSMVTEQLARLGAGVLDADRAGHEVLRQPAVEAAVRERWGDEVFDVEGRVDRRQLAEIVFAPPPNGPAERKYLEKLTHPEIGRALRRRANEMAAGGIKVVVLDAALLIEAGWDEMCDRLIFVNTPRDLRQRWAFSRGWSEEEFAAREAAQKSLDLKKRRADAILDNSGTPEHTFAQVEHFWQSLSD